MISTRTMATAALAIAAATGCTAAHGHATASGPSSDASASPTTGTASSPAVSSPSPQSVPTTTTSPSPEPAATSTSPAPVPDPSPTVNVRAGASDLCTNGSVDLWSYANDAATNEVASVVLNLRFVASSGQELDSRPGMTKDSGIAYRWDRTVMGRDFFGQTGTLHYSVTATDSAGHSTTTASFTLPVDTC